MKEEKMKEEFEELFPAPNDLLAEKLRRDYKTMEEWLPHARQTVDALVEQLQLSEEDKKLLEQDFGIAANTAERTVDLEGIGPVDQDVADLIKIFWDAGYETIASCSGTGKDHGGKEEKEGYISIVDTPKARKLILKIKDCGFLRMERAYTYLRESINLYFAPERIKEVEKLIMEQKVCL